MLKEEQEVPTDDDDSKWAGIYTCMLPQEEKEKEG